MDQNRLISDGNPEEDDAYSRPLLDPEDGAMNDVVDGSSSLSRDQVENPVKDVVNDSNILVAEYSNWRKYMGIAILFYINLLNYMDRFTIAGVLVEIKADFQINNAMAGLLQTVFIISYMLVAPVFGYLGDRYNRKVIMIFGMILWSGFTFISSFINKPELFPLFVLMRALVGIGEASYSTIAPTLIGDLFMVGKKRTRMLSIFFFATPIGSGLGYIVGSQMAKAFGGWEWALRLTPALGVIAIFLLIFLCPNPRRGASETPTSTGNNRNTHSYYEDLLYLSKNTSFILITVGFTSMAFVMGCLTFWAPLYVAYAEIAIGVLQPCVSDTCDYTEIGFVFGLITCIGGFTGIATGVESARRLKGCGIINADPLVCATGLIFGAVWLLIAFHTVIHSINASWVLVFFTIVSMCVTWALVGDMLLYVIEPSRRSTANAVQLLIGHLFGDAGSPYLIGLIADALMVGKADTYMNKYMTLQSAMYINLFIGVLGGGGFLLTSLFVVRDKEKVDKFLKCSSSSSNGTHSSRSSNSTESQNSIQLVVKHSNGLMGNQVLTNGAVEGVGGSRNDDGIVFSDEVDSSRSNLLG